MNRHFAPAVSYPAGRSGYLSLLVVGMVLLGAAAVAWYCYRLYASTQQLNWEWGWRWVLVAGAWLISAFSAWHFIGRLQQGELDFDGENWYFADQVGTVSIRFDGQNCLLLRFESEFKRVYWLWLEARSVLSFTPSHWHDLRRAVYSRPALQNSPHLI